MRQLLESAETFLETAPDDIDLGVMDMQESEPKADEEQDDWMRVQQPDGDEEEEIPAYQISQPDQMLAEHCLAYWHQDDNHEKYIIKILI